MDQTFLDEPAQSETARRAGIIPPPAVTFADVGNRDSIQQKKRLAEGYLELIENRRVRYGPREVEDLDLHEAVNYNIGCQVGTMMPAIGSALRAMTANDIVQILTHEDGPLMRFLSNRFDQMNNRFDQLDDKLADIRRTLSAIEIRQTNEAALTPDDVLFAPPAVSGGDPPILSFTVSELFEMGYADLTQLEHYYEMSHDGELEFRRRKILQKIGAIKLP